MRFRLSSTWKYRCNLTYVYYGITAIHRRWVWSLSDRRYSEDYPPFNFSTILNLHHSSSSSVLNYCYDWRLLFNNYFQSSNCFTSRFAIAHLMVYLVASTLNSRFIDQQESLVKLPTELIVWKVLIRGNGMKVFLSNSEEPKPIFSCWSL